MKEAVLKTLVALLVLGAALVALAPHLPSTAGAGAQPAGPSSGPPAWTQRQLDAWLTSGSAALITLAIAKGAPLLLGVVFLIQELLRADRRRAQAALAGAFGPSAPATGPAALAGPPTTVASASQALGLTVLFVLGVQLVAGSLLHALDDGRVPTEAQKVERGIAIAFVSLMPLAALTVLRRRRLSGGALPSAGAGLAEGLRYACLALLLVLPVSLAWAWSLSLSGVPLEVQSLVQKFAQPDSPSQPWLVAVFGAFVAPFTEECVFRGLLYPALRRAVPGGPFGAAVVVSVLFAAIHGSLLAFLPLFLLAMVLSGVMERTNSLLACVVVHAVHNATSLAPMLARMLEGGPA